jgi:hypothetical protein
LEAHLRVSSSWWYEAKVSVFSRRVPTLSLQQLYQERGGGNH